MSDTLVVVIKTKKYIKDKSGLNTSASAMDAITKIVIDLCLSAIDVAANDGRKTVMDRDLKLTDEQNAIETSATLVVVSKVKNHIKDKSGMNTSATAIVAFTKKVQDHCDKAIEKAKEAGRKTALDRDFETDQPTPVEEVPPMA